MKTRLLTLVDTLRANGLSITAAETLDAMHAVAAIGVERASLREGLAAALVKDEADRPTFDAVFQRCFGLPARPRGRSDRPQSGGEGGGRGAGMSETPRSTRLDARPPRQSMRQERPTEQRAERRTEAGRNEREQREPGGQLAHQRALLQMPFREMSAHDITECAALVTELARRVRAHASRRLRAERRGRLDMRRTIRRSISSGGVPLAPAFRSRRPARPDLVALCDCSHSVATVSDFFLALLAPAHDFFRRVRLFAFVDRPVEISIERGAVIPHERLDLYARSDFGKTLIDFWERHEPLLTRNTIVLVLGDARNNRQPPRTDMLGRIQTAVRRVVWLNPEQPQRWNTGDSTMQAYARHCNAVLAASNLHELFSCVRSTLARP